MKTAIFTLAAVLGLGLGLALVGVEFGLHLLATLLVCLALAILVWAFADRLHTLPALAAPSITPLVKSLARPFAQRFHPGSIKTLARLVARSRALAMQIRHLPFSPLHSALMGFALGAVLARDRGDLPLAVLCGALAATLHLVAFGPPTRRARTEPKPDRIADRTQTHLEQLITALAPCRDPHLHVAARALRREALALAAQVDRAPNLQTDAHRALTLWLPALVMAAEHLRNQSLTTHDPAKTADMTATLASVTDQLAQLAAQTESRIAAPQRREPHSWAQTTH
jgi:hypothetical protein